MALETTASIISNFDSNLPTNNQGQITADVLRTEMKRLANNMRRSIEDIVLINPSDTTDKTVFKRQDLKDLKLGKPIADGAAKTAGKSNTHPGDEGTFIKQKSTVPGRVDHVVSNVTMISIQTSSFSLGSTSVPVRLNGSTLSITGSTTVSGSTTISGSFNQSGSFNSEGDSTFNGTTTITGSFEQSGSSTFTGGGFNVNNLLDLLSNYGQTGIPTGSGEGGGVSAGDINLDGQVNVNDLLLVLAGYGNPNQICNDQIIPSNVNHQFVGPEISVCSGSILSIGLGSFCSITS